MPWQERGDKERWRQREGAVACVVRALSDMTYIQNPCAKFELLMSLEATELSTGTKGQEDRLNQYPPSHRDLASPHSFFISLTFYYTEAERYKLKEGKEGRSRRGSAEGGDRGHWERGEGKVREKVKTMMLKVEDCKR